MIDYSEHFDPNGRDFTIDTTGGSAELDGLFNTRKIKSVWARKNPVHA